MKNKKTAAREINWTLVFISSVLIIFGLVLAVLSIRYAHDFGWWSLLIGSSGLTTVAAAVMSIIKNDPSWILMDLIIPG